MTVEEELQKLIEEQRRDDVYRISTHVPYGFRAVPLDKTTTKQQTAMNRGSTIGEVMIGVTADGEYVDFMSRDVAYDMNTECGIASSYTNRGCRCAACTAAQTAKHVAWYAKNRKQPGETRPCEVCGSEFSTLTQQTRHGKPFTNNAPHQKYCSEACQKIGYRERDSARQRVRRAAQRRSVAA